MVEEIDALALKNTPPQLSTGCEEDALFDITYDPYATVTVNEPVLIPDDRPNTPKDRKRAKLDDDSNVIYTAVERRAEVPAGADGELRVLRVCANDDLMREWPRFQHVIQDRDPSR